MNDKDYIRKAVELADGWRIAKADGRVWTPITRSGSAMDRPEQMSGFYLDALAAELVRQVDSVVQPYRIDIYHDVTQLFFDDSITERMEAYSGGNGRAMNTTKVIVDSGVLEHG